MVDSQTCKGRLNRTNANWYRHSEGQKHERTTNGHALHTLQGNMYKHYVKMCERQRKINDIYSCHNVKNEKNEIE